MKHLVVGSKGFLGSALLPALPDAVGMDRGTGEESDLSGGFIACDVTRAYDLERDFRSLQPSTVWHLAALNGSTRGFYDEPWKVLETQIRGTLNVIDACVANGVGTLVLFSSSEVFATPPVIPTPEDVPFSVPDPSNPRFSYSIGKQAAEAMARWSPIPRVIIVRPFNVYGPGQGPGHVVPDVLAGIARLGAGEYLHTEGDASAVRAFCYVDDFVAGCLAIIRKHESDESCREVYNVGDDHGVSHIGAVARKLCELAGAHYGGSGTARPGEPSERCPDVSKLRALGWEPKVALEAGLQRCVEAWR